MQRSILPDYKFAVPQSGCVIRAPARVGGTCADARGRMTKNLCLALDKSGSMGGDKLAAAIEVASHLVGRVRTDDVVNIVACGNDSRAIASPVTGEKSGPLSVECSSKDSGDVRFRA